MRDLDQMTTTIGTLLAAHAAGKSLAATIEETYARIEKHNDPALFIAVRPKSEALAISERMQASGPEGKPLYGVPFVVKDNIDVAGLPTTAACPAFAYRPEKSAFVVEKLEQSRGNRHRQDQSRPVCDRPRRRPFALWGSTQRVAGGSDTRRIELRLGGGGRRGPRPVFAWH